MPISVLKASPFSLDWGREVYAKVLATNLVGNSDYSIEGTGAVILTTPNAPVTLTNNVAVTNKD